MLVGRSLDLANLFHTGLFAQRWPFYGHTELEEALVTKCVVKSYFSWLWNRRRHTNAAVALVTCVEGIVLKQGMKEGRREMIVLSEQTGGSKALVE